MQRPLPFNMNMMYEDTTKEGNRRHLKKLLLLEDIEMLQGDLEREQALNKILKTALQGPTFLPPSDCSLIPLQVQVLLAELVWEEEQIIALERKIRGLKMNMYQGTKQSKKLALHHRSKQLQYNEIEAREYYRHGLGQGTRMHDYEQIMRKGKIMTSDGTTFSRPIMGRRQCPSSSATANEENFYCIVP